MKSIRPKKNQNPGTPKKLPQKNRSISEQGSSLVYVMMLLSVAATFTYFELQKPDHYSVYAIREKQNAFTIEMSEKTTTQLNCPGGIVKISKNSCTSSPSLKISIGQLRNWLFQAQASYQILNGALPPSAKGVEVASLMQQRMECYRVQSYIDPATKAPYYTPQGAYACDQIRSIDSKVTPFPSANRLTGGDLAVNFNQNLKILLDVIYPDLQNKINASTQLIVTMQAEYKTLFKTFTDLRDACKAPPPPPPPTGTGTSTGASTGTSTGTTTVPPPPKNCPSPAEIAAAKAAANAKKDQIVAANQAKTAYLTLLEFIDTGILDKAPSILTNNQLAAMQKTGGFWKTLLLEGTQGGNKYLMERVPTLAQAQAIGSGNPKEFAETFSFQLIKLDPICKDDPSDPKSERKLMVFRAQIDTAAVNKQFPVLSERRAVLTGLERALFYGKSSKNGWAELPLNYVPSRCTLIEEEDPIINPKAISDAP